MLIILFHSLFIKDYTSLNLLETGNRKFISDLLCLNKSYLALVNVDLIISSIFELTLFTVFGLIG